MYLKFKKLNLLPTFSSRVSLGAVCSSSAYRDHSNLPYIVLSSEFPDMAGANIGDQLGAQLMKAAQVIEEQVDNEMNR